MERVMRLGALNVVTQPHSAERYQDLLLRVRNRRKAGRIRGDRFGMIAQMAKSESPRSANACLEGFIGTFTQIDENSDWINVSTGMKAESDELSRINIPKNLRPNMAYHMFRFYLREHLLVFEIGNSGAKLTPSNAKHLFERLFSPDPITKEFGEVAVTVWPSRDTITTILAEQGLRSLHLVINAPNPDDGKEAEARYMKRLESINAKRIETQVVAKKEGRLEPDAVLVEAAKVANTNGRVDATVKRGGRTIKISTTDTPFIYTHTYHTEVNTAESEFRIACDVIRHQLREER